MPFTFYKRLQIISLRVQIENKPHIVVSVDIVYCAMQQQLQYFAVFKTLQTFDRSVQQFEVGDFVFDRMKKQAEEKFSSLEIPDENCGFY